MAQKNICSVPQSWDLAEYRQHSCYDSSHHHKSRAEIEKLEKRGLVVWLRHPDRSEKSNGVCYVVPHLAEIEKIFDQSSFGVGSPNNSGLSFRVGEYHAAAVVSKIPWAQVMLSEINRSHLENDEIVP